MFYSLHQLFAFDQVIIIRGMSKKLADDQYNNDKELKKAHSIITTKKRQKLIELVIEQGMTIYRAAKRLKICHPTAKFIVKNYRAAHNLPRQGQKQQEKKRAQDQTENRQVAQDVQKSPEFLSGVEEKKMQEWLFPLNQFIMVDSMWTLYGGNNLMPAFYYYP